MLKILSAKNSAALDKDLMSIGAFSIDQLMELAGLSVSQAGSPFSSLKVQSLNMFIVVYRIHPPRRGRRILVACGPGNNGEFVPRVKVHECVLMRNQVAMALLPLVISGITDINLRFTIPSKARMISTKYMPAFPTIHLKPGLTPNPASNNTT
jgi:hypothetical protein